VGRLSEAEGEKKIYTRLGLGVESDLLCAVFCLKEEPE
jgi:hypothetical protein